MGILASRTSRGTDKMASRKRRLFTPTMLLLACLSVAGGSKISMTKAEDASMLNTITTQQTIINSQNSELSSLVTKLSSQESKLISQESKLNSQESKLNSQQTE